MIHLDQLIATLMQVVIDNSGAEIGALVLLEEDQLIVMAQCSRDKPCDLEKIAVADCATISVSVIHSVERTQETLVLDDAVSKPSFSTDPYIQQHQTRSLLCLPILNQSQLIGILYLENNSSTGVFTRDRLQVLKLLIDQAAISLEIARLYERLANYAETLERKLEAQTQILQQEIIDRERTEDALRQSEANYRNLLQTANSVIIRYDPQGRIHYINDYGVKLLGYEEHQILGRTLFETIIPDIELSGRDVKPMVLDLLRNPQAYPQGEGENLCRDGRRVWVAWSNQAIFNDQGEVVEILSVGNDTTQRRHAEVALQASEAELRSLFSAIPDPMCIFDGEGQLICAIQGNPSYGELYREEYTGKTLHQLYVREQADEFLSYIQQALSTQQVLTVEYSQWIAGREIWFSARIAPIRHEQVLWLARDITLQKQAEATSILEERNRMAREIHDTLAQSFTGILAQVGAANQVLTDDVEATGAHLDLIKELARTGLTEARRSVVALRPQLLEEGSLQSALHRLVAQLRTAAMDTTLYYEIEGAVYALPSEVESNLLRIGQEALTNAIKHAHADEIRVELTYDRNQFYLRVKDNGQGFGVGSIPSSEGFGLLGMSERAERIGAQLTIKSQPGQGTEMIVTVNRE
ncbi:PAS domain S-box protein [Pantanalinema sp. GBBB05]|uniref:sensor histidine kinase n=1 Tax=Pantanalinema sp. GBBB05 TaxID=2604139 RepID=UPI001D2EC443|nr:PAS domain S-box protein [Pantanalinema sp. GBBB05]